jgi:hypothetical protein
MILILVNFIFIFYNENGLKMVLDIETCSLLILEPKNKCAKGIYTYITQDA